MRAGPLRVAGPYRILPDAELNTTGTARRLWRVGDGGQADDE